MRQGDTLPTIMVGILTIGIGLYFVISIWDALTDTYTSTIAYTYVLSDSVDAKGVLLREEVVLPSASGLLDILRTEGEQVGVGQVVGRVYRDVNTMQEQNQLEARIKEAEVLEYALSEKMDIISVTKMDEEIVSAMSALRGAVASSSYYQLENQVASLQGAILRRDFVFGSALVVKSLQDRYATVSYEIQNTSQTVTGNVNQITTPVSGAYSILVDGMESVTVDEVKGYSIPELEALLDSSVTAIDQGTGKIITGDTWYFVTSLESEWAQDMRLGGEMTVRFSGDFSQDITMTIEFMGETDNGKRMLVLSSNRYLEQTTLLRVQTVEIVYQSYSGLRVPKEAMRMVSYTNSETGEVREEYGVYVVSAGYAEFKPAKILSEGNDFYVVEGTNQGANTLRAGNEIIVNGVGLYHGKLLEY